MLIMAAWKKSLSKINNIRHFSVKYESQNLNQDFKEMFQTQTGIPIFCINKMCRILFLFAISLYSQKV